MCMSAEPQADAKANVHLERRPDEANNPPSDAGTAFREADTELDGVRELAPYVT